VILAIDQGTTGTTCMVFAEDGTVAGRAYREFAQHFPKPGWVEHDASEIWDVTLAVAKEAVDDAGGGEPKAIGITNQRETVVAWDRKTGEPLAPAIVWQDRRTAERCAELKEEGREQLVRDRTGLVLDPYFSGTKIEWLIRHGGVDPARAAFGTIDAWLIHNLCDGRFATDYSNASRTLLFDIDRLDWSDELCEMLGVPRDALPEPCPTAHEFGTTTLFGGSVPVAGVAGDQQAALYGQACQEAGLGKNTYGTGSFVLENAGGERPSSADGLLTTVAWGIADRVDYALEAAIFVTGAAVQWLRDGLGIIEEAADTEPLARSLDSNDGVYFVPALTGLGSPHWDPFARGTIVGLTRGTTKAHLARAALEAMAYQTVDAVRAMEESSGVRLEELRADGGATANGWMLQFQADLLGVPVVVPEISETTALGAAYLAGVATGLWTEGDVREMWAEAARYEPEIGQEQREELMGGWRQALDATRNHSRGSG
jgi:glycerol kinase